MSIQKQKVIKYLKYFGLVIAGAAVVGITWAAFSDTGKVLGSSFSVGSSDIKLLDNLTAGVDITNLKDEIQGPSFANVVPDWTQDYLIKIYNNGTTPLELTSNSEYETVNDPDDLRSYLYVEPIEWNDENNNGALDSGEEGTSLGKKTIIKWKTEGFDFGRIETGAVKGFVLRFSAGTLSDTKQGKAAIYNFEFNAIQL